jgi:hypothetical protein
VLVSGLDRLAERVREERGEDERANECGETAPSPEVLLRHGSEDSQTGADAALKRSGDAGREPGCSDGATNAPG